MDKFSRIKYLLVPAIGFGIGGALWGWIEDSIFFQGSGVGVILFGLFSIFSLIVSENIKFQKKIIFILTGILFWVVVFLIGNVALFFSSIVFPAGIVFCFLLLGLVIDLFYALALSLLLKIRIWPVFWRGLVGLSLAFMIILLSGEVFNLKEIAGIFLFVIAAILFGLFLGWGRYKGQKIKEIIEQKREKI